MKSKKPKLSDFKDILYGNPRMVQESITPVSVKPADVSVKSVGVSVKPTDIPVRVSKKNNKRRKWKGRAIQVYEKDTKVLDAVCSKLSISKSQAYKTSLRIFAGSLNLL